MFDRRSTSVEDVDLIKTRNHTRKLHFTGQRDCSINPLLSNNSTANVYENIIYTFSSKKKMKMRILVKKETRFVRKCFIFFNSRPFYTILNIKLHKSSVFDRHWHMYDKPSWRKQKSMRSLFFLNDVKQKWLKLTSTDEYVYLPVEKLGQRPIPWNNGFPAHVFRMKFLISYQDTYSTLSEKNE